MLACLPLSTANIKLKFVSLTAAGGKGDFCNAPRQTAATCLGCSDISHRNYSCLRLLTKTSSSQMEGLSQGVTGAINSPRIFSFSRGSADYGCVALSSFIRDV